MGACGCGDYQGEFKFKGPGNITYVMQIYESCDYCDTPAGVILYAFDPDEAKHLDVASLREEKITSDGIAIPVIHPKNLMQTIVESIEACIEDGISGEFRSAVWKTRKEWAERVHKITKSGKDER
jgi:hypothetical protein